jgi:hypothetical protein
MLLHQILYPDTLYIPVLAGDANILEIKCDGTLPKCDWCHHHSIPCTYARNEDLGRSRKTPNTKLKLVHV